jgi:hypothetical protein
LISFQKIKSTRNKFNKMSENAASTELLERQKTRKIYHIHKGKVYGIDIGSFKKPPQVDSEVHEIQRAQPVSRPKSLKQQQLVSKSTLFNSESVRQMPVARANPVFVAPPPAAEQQETPKLKAAKVTYKNSSTQSDPPRLANSRQVITVEIMPTARAQHNHMQSQTDDGFGSGGNFDSFNAKSKKDWSESDASWSSGRPVTPTVPYLVIMKEMSRQEQVPTQMHSRSSQPPPPRQQNQPMRALPAPPPSETVNNKLSNESTLSWHDKSHATISRSIGRYRFVDNVGFYK